MKTPTKRMLRNLLYLITKGRYKQYKIDVIRQIVLFNIVTALGSVVLVILGSIAFLGDIKLLGGIDCILALVLFLDLLYTRQTQNYRFGIFSAIGCFTLLCYYLFITGGAYGAGYLWYFTYPLLTCFGLGARKGVIASAILIIPSMIAINLKNLPIMVANYSEGFGIRFFSAFFVITALAYIAERAREDTQSRLEDKNAKLNQAISELKMAEEKLRRSSDELEKRVVERTNQLSETNEKLKREIQERMQAEAARHESEEKYRLIAENTADIICIMDMNLSFTYISPSVLRVRGVTPEEAVSETMDQVLTSESLRLAIACYEEEMALEASGTADPNRIRFLELEEYKKDGSTIWVEVSFAFIRNKDGWPKGILAVVRDINERKQAEKERARLEEQLTQAQKLESIGTLAGGIAHDFNNLLMAIQGCASLMLLDLNPSHPHYERLKQMEQQITSGANLTKQLLGFARGGRYEVKPTNMNLIIDKTSSMFGRMNKGIVIYRKLEPNLCAVKVDQGQMEQVLLNLYLNAGQAMPGGGKMDLQTDNVFFDAEQARAYGAEPGKYVKILIADTGTGIDDNTRKRIFEPFFTTKGMGRGTGLGLAMVYGIIKGHQGIIDVTSEVGQGTTFNIYLPATEAPLVQEKAVTEEILKGTESILLVDDESIVLEVSRQLLTALGYRIYVAGSGQEALAVYEQKGQEIDLVILDMVMPGISGSETYDHLYKINPQIRVILSSGYSLEGQAQQILNRGCKGFLQKPFELQALSQKVQEVLQN